MAGAPAISATVSPASATNYYVRSTVTANSTSCYGVKGMRLRSVSRLQRNRSDRAELTKIEGTGRGNQGWQHSCPARCLKLILKACTDPFWKKIRLQKHDNQEFKTNTLHSLFFSYVLNAVDLSLLHLRRYFCLVVGEKSPGLRLFSMFNPPRFVGFSSTSRAKCAARVPVIQVIF